MDERDDRRIVRFVFSGCSRSPSGRPTRKLRESGSICSVSRCRAATAASARTSTKTSRSSAWRCPGRGRPDRSPSTRTSGRPFSRIPRSNTSGSGSTISSAAVEWLGAQGVRFTPGGIRKGAWRLRRVLHSPEGRRQRSRRGAKASSSGSSRPPDVVAAPGRLKQAEQGATANESGVPGFGGRRAARRPRGASSRLRRDGGMLSAHAVDRLDDRALSASSVPPQPRTRTHLPARGPCSARRNARSA